MHRYAAGGSSGIGGSQGGGSGGGPGAREARGSDSFTSASATTYGLSSSRQQQQQQQQRAGQLVPYKLKCEKEPLSHRFGPPDFYPPVSNCPEEVLNRDCCVNGYKELIDGIEEASEVKLSLTSQNYSTYWSKQNTNKYKEAIRKRLRILNNALIRKRKAGQVYGVALTGSLLGKAGGFPELRTCGEDFRKKWIEDLSQRKRLKSLAEHVPHGYRRRVLFETLIKHNVPLLRATWFIKIMYLNQVRPMSIGMSAGGPDKSQSKRVEHWTKDVLEYAQSLLDEFCLASRQSTSSLYSSTPQQQQQGGGEAGRDVPEVDLHGKWRYMVRLAQWHYSEGLLHRAQLVDWVMKQLQDKDSADALELLIPMVLKLIDDISLSQTHVRTLVDIFVHWLRKLCPADGVSNGVDQQPHLKYTVVTLTELLRYLLLTVPDTFVALDCFPLPSCVCPEQPRQFLVPVLFSTGNGKNEMAYLQQPGSNAGDDGRTHGKMGMPNLPAPGKIPSDRELLIEDVVEGIQRRAGSLAKAVIPGLLRNNEGKVVQALDKALIGGDIQGACTCVFYEDFCSSGQLPDEWQADVIPGFGRNPSLLKSVNSSELFAIRFLCEWAVCEFRDSRGVSRLGDRKTFKLKDMSRVYMAVSVIRRRMEELNEKGNSSTTNGDSRTPNGDLNANRDDIAGRYSGAQTGAGIFASPGPMHDLIVAWLDQHQLPKGESLESLNLLLLELVRVQLFFPEAYVRQLLCSGVLDKSRTAAEISRAARHKLILQHLPGPQLAEGGDSESTRLARNERYLALHGFNVRKVKAADTKVGAADPMNIDGVQVLDDCMSNGPEAGVKKGKKPRLRFWEIKQAIASLLQFPEGSVDFSGNGPRSKSRRGIKRRATSPASGLDKVDITPGCEECSRSKRSKKNDGKAWNSQVLVPAVVDEDDTWWLRKGQKALDAAVIKIEPPVKPPSVTKQNTRGRPKTVRKTQSLAQLAAARIENSQGACSSGQTNETKAHCPYHGRSTFDNQSGTSQNRERRSKWYFGNSARAIGNAIKSLRFSEKRGLSCWLNDVVRNLLTGGGGNGSPNPSNNLTAEGMSIPPATPDGGSGVRWKMNDEQLAMVVNIMDTAHDFYSLAQLLLWLLPMAPGPSAMTHGHGSRGISTPQWNRDNSTVEVSEAAFLSYLRRYEGVLVAMDLLPQALRAGMQRAETLMAAVPGGRAGCSALLCYVCDLLKRYGGLDSVHSWEKNWKTTCDQRLSAELEALKAGDCEGGFSMVGMSSSGVGDEREEPTPQRLTGRLVRVGTNMKDIVSRGMNEAVTQILNKEKELVNSNLRDRSLDRFDEGHHAAQRVVGGVMDAIRQNGSGAPQGDSALVATAVSYLVGSAGTSVANVYESLGASNNVGLGGAPGLASSLKCAKQVLQVHVLGLRLLKEALGDRHSRMVEVALATEANATVVQAMQHPAGRAPPIAFRSSPEHPENSGLGNEYGAGANGLGRYHIQAAAIASFVAMLAVQGITSLERMVTVLKMRENLETLQIPKMASTNASSISRSATGTSNLKDHVAEAYVLWFRVLIGDCRNVVGGFVADLLGEANILGLARMQLLMPLTTIFSPAYALFAAALRRQPQTYVNSVTVREDTLLNAAINAVNDVVAHEPFRDVCLRDSRALYLLLSSDSGEGDYASMLDMQGLDVFSKVAALVPLRARLFLHSILDRGLPLCLLQDDDLWGEGRLDVKNRFANEPRQVQQLVQVLDDLQPATYHWQWVELRLLLNEQVLIEKLEVQNMSAVDAVHAAAAAGSDTRQLSECEKTFTEVVLTRLLVRPDAAALYSEAVHSLGRALEEYLILQVKWVLEGYDMLHGRKSLYQLLENIATRQGFSIENQKFKMWGWRPVRHMGEVGSGPGSVDRKAELATPEEGEVAEGGSISTKEGGQRSEQEGLSGQQFATEKALADLVLPCLARSSNDTCSSFAFDLIKQMSNLEQHITQLGRSSKSAPTSSTDSGLGGKAAGLRRGARGGLEGGSPGIGRKTMPPISDPAGMSAGALQASMWLRLQFLLPLLPIIQSDREQTARNMRQTLAPVLLRLLGTSVVQKTVECLHSGPARDPDKRAEASAFAASTAAGEDLFDRLLSVLHGLLSSTWAVWLKSPPRPTSKGPSKPLREVPPFDRDIVERMQAELEHMQLPQSICMRLRAALPLLPAAPPLTISAGPPQVPLAALALTTNNLSRGQLGAVPLKPINLGESNLGKGKAPYLTELEVEVDPWMLLEDGVGFMSIGGSAALGPGEGGNLKACPWLKGTLRVRRNGLTYIGAVDEDP